MNNVSETGAYALTGWRERSTVCIEASVVRYTEGPGCGVHRIYGT
jgi:hypothetical protein